MPWLVRLWHGSAGFLGDAVGRIFPGAVEHDPLVEIIHAGDPVILDAEKAAYDLSDVFIEVVFAFPAILDLHGFLFFPPDVRCY
jgi:hypothetical protein